MYTSATAIEQSSCFPPQIINPGGSHALDAGQCTIFTPCTPGCGHTMCTQRSTPVSNTHMTQVLSAGGTFIAPLETMAILKPFGTHNATFLWAFEGRRCLHTYLRWPAGLSKHPWCFNSGLNPPVTSHTSCVTSIPPIHIMCGLSHLAQPKWLLK